MKLIAVNLKTRFDETLYRISETKNSTEKMYSNLQIQTETLG